MSNNHGIAIKKAQIIISTTLPFTEISIAWVFAMASTFINLTFLGIMSKEIKNAFIWCNDGND